MDVKTNPEKDEHIDPVCGMTVSGDGRYRFEHAGEKYYFCSEHCLNKFREHPERYLQKESPPARDSHAAPGDCTCPMHPEVRQDHPGSCPKCGMALEAVTVDVEEKNEELADMSRRFWISAVLAFPVFLLAMIADLAPSRLPAGLSLTMVQWIGFALATPVVLWGGWPFFVRGWQSLRTRNLNMFTLIALGVSVAWAYSVAALLFPGIFPATMQMKGGRVDVYFEAAAMITTLVLLG